MRRIVRFFVSLAVAVLAMLIAESVTGEDADAQQRAFPEFAADTLVRDRLAIEWQQDNRFQHERGYCVLYKVVNTLDEFGRPVVVYWLTDIRRAEESHESATGGTLECQGLPNETLLHIHPPAVCPSNDEGAGCVQRHPFAQQCFASPTDMSELNRSNQPFWVIQCDKYALVPIWRTEPYPLLKPTEGFLR